MPLFIQLQSVMLTGGSFPFSATSLSGHTVLDSVISTTKLKTVSGSITESEYKRISYSISELKVYFRILKFKFPFIKFNVTTPPLTSWPRSLYEMSRVTPRDKKAFQDKFTFYW